MTSKHALLIAAHKNTGQIKRLIRALDHPNNDIFLHLDSRFKEVKPRDFVSAARYSHVDCVSFCHPAWGSYSQVNMYLQLMEHALQTGPHSYYHLLSGQDYPLVTPEKMHEFFAEETHEFIHFCDPSEWERQVTNRISVVRHPEARFKKIERSWAAVKQRMPGTQLRADTRYAYGSNWFSATEDLVRQLVENRDWIAERFSHALIPDEHYLQSFVLTFGLEDRLYVPVGHKSTRSNMRAIDWERGSENHPYTWRSSDFEQLAASGMLFARKFDAALDSKILDMIDSKLLHLE